MSLFLCFVFLPPSLPPSRIFKVALYGHLLDDYDRTEVLNFANADTPQVTTDAIAHALTSAFPLTRYYVASAAGMHASVIKSHVLYPL